MSDSEHRDVLATFNAYDDEEVKLHAHVAGFAAALWDIREHVHELLKYGHKFDSVDAALEEIEEFINGEYDTFDLPTG
jgi:hypothetical protein